MSPAKFANHQLMIERFPPWQCETIGRRKAKMSKPDLSIEEYDALICKLATLESELKHAQKLLEAPKKAGWWKRFWGAAAVVALIVSFFAGSGHLYCRIGRGS